MAATLADRMAVLMQGHGITTVGDSVEQAAVNAIYAEYMPDPPPARSAVAGSGLALGALVEVECIAVAP